MEEVKVQTRYWISLFVNVRIEDKGIVTWRSTFESYRVGS